LESSNPFLRKHLAFKRWAKGSIRAIRANPWRITA
jgi:hypothetical protein